MRAFLLLTISLTIVFSQDQLIFKKGASYNGKLIKIQDGKVHFLPENIANFNPVKLKKIKRLKQSGKLIIEDGFLVSNPGQSMVTKDKQPSTVRKTQVPSIATTYIDVLILKNGDIIKGEIVEHKINKHIRMELMGGSILTFEYDRISAIEREKSNRQ